MEEFIAMIFELFYSCLSLAWSALPIVGMWLVFEKAGEKGWKAVIPFYNMYTMFMLGDRKKYWTPYLIGCIVFIVSYVALMAYLAWILFAFIAALGAVDLGWDAITTIWPVILVACFAAFVGWIMMLVAEIHGYSGICKKMNQDTGYVIGLIFLGPIFWMILGAGKSCQWEKPAEPVYQAPEYNPAEYHAPEWKEPFVHQEDEFGR